MPFPDEPFPLNLETREPPRAARWREPTYEVQTTRTWFYHENREDYPNALAIIDDAVWPQVDPGGPTHEPVSYVWMATEKWRVKSARFVLEGPGVGAIIVIVGDA